MGRKSSYEAERDVRFRDFRSPPTPAFFGPRPVRREAPVLCGAERPVRIRERARRDRETQRIRRPSRSLELAEVPRLRLPSEPERLSRGLEEATRRLFSHL